jgi:oligopeptide/dipeptide ABC transporter ATP-binding protein
MDADVDELPTIPGIVPNPLNFPSGCKYHTRCPLQTEQCRTEEPPLYEIAARHFTRCWHYKELEELKQTSATIERL